MSNGFQKLAVNEPDFIEVYGANEHNLKNINVKIPRNKLVVITGLSGSGKSSLAFDTIFAEGQRRYIESFSAYARQFLGNLSKPSVEKISGLSPVIAIEQKTTSKSPRSTVGTTTEIYDFLRLLFARLATAYSYNSGKAMVSYTQKEIVEKILKENKEKKVVILAPLVKGRKGHYRELFEKLAKQGYTKVRVDGELKSLEKGMQVDRYKVHDIELAVDRIVVNSDVQTRLKASVENALKNGGGALIVLNESNQEQFYSLHLTCPESGLSYNLPEPNLFSFNSPYGACPSCKGLGVKHSFDEDKVVPNKSISIAKGAIIPLGSQKKNYLFEQIKVVADKYNHDLNQPYNSLSTEFIEELLFGDAEEEWEGLFNYLMMQGEFSTGAEKKLQQYMKEQKCATCEGQRLNKEALHFKIGGQNISEVAQLDIKEFRLWLDTVPDFISDNQQVIATEILKEVKDKTDFLLDVGLYYLSLDRTAKTLSGGESQRIRLASQIGAQLVGVLYILDEPSIGLHPNDNRQLIAALQKLKNNGNSVIVVEHDKEIMEKSDYIIDVGPKAGVNGGEVIDAGKPSELKNKDSLTYQYLNSVKKILIPDKVRKGNGTSLKIKNATGHNLKSVQLEIKLGTLTCVTGVSGSGKSSLIKGTLSPILFNHLYHGTHVPLPHGDVLGLEHIDKVIEVDQSPIGRTPRSNPATYTGVFTDIRNVFASLPQSKIFGFTAGKFSFNVVGGRCEECKGAGVQTIEMNFLPDVYVSCKACNGKRYKKEILKVKYKGKSIYDVLEMPIDEAVRFFESYHKIKRKIQALDSVGLSYVKLGQPSTTLSGGEAQRIKLASELYKKDTGKTLYILDEPTTGLHFEDIRVLLEVMNRIVDKGNTMLVIEHNMDVIKSADYIIDLGIEGGKNGGEIVASGTPTQVSKNKKSLTGKFILEEIQFENGRK